MSLLHFCRQVVQIVFGHRPHKRPHDLCFGGIAEVLRHGYKLNLIVSKALLKAHMLGQAAGYPVIFVDQNDAEKPLVRVLQHLLILYTGGSFGFLAANRFIGVHAGDLHIVPLGVLRTGSHLCVYAGLVLPVRRKPGVYYGVRWCSPLSIWVGRQVIIHKKSFIC